MAETKLKGKSMEARLNDRLLNSGCDTAVIVHKAGDGARRTFTNIHQRGQGGADARLNLSSPADQQKQGKVTR